MRQYPDLFKPAVWSEIVAVQFYAAQVADESLIGNVNIVPFVGDKVVIVRTEAGTYEIPGGTLEPDEPYLETIKRELMEEAGAHLKSDFVPCGYWLCRSLLPQPYRPYLPHPEFIRLVGYGQIDLISTPGNPEDGEQIAAVEVLSVGEAARVFRDAGRADLADLYQWVVDQRL